MEKSGMKKQVLRPGIKKPESGRRIGSGPARLLPVFCIILLLAGCGYGAADTAAQTEETLSREEDETGRTLDPPGADEGIGSAFGSVEEQLSDGTSILNYYRRALLLRNENPEIARGTARKVEALCKEQYAAVLKTWGDSSIAIVYNISDEEAEIDLKEGGLEEMEIRGSLTLNGEEIGRTQDVICMPGQSVCILK